MGCRVNGPGETDDADLGLWCAPTFVNLKRGEDLVGKFKYDEVVGKLKQEVDQLIEQRSQQRRRKRFHAELAEVKKSRREKDKL